MNTRFLDSSALLREVSVLHPKVLFLYKNKELEREIELHRRWTLTINEWLKQLESARLSRHETINRFSIYVFIYAWLSSKMSQNKMLTKKTWGLTFPQVCDPKWLQTTLILQTWTITAHTHYSLQMPPVPLRYCRRLSARKSRGSSLEHCRARDTSSQ